MKDVVCGMDMSESTNWKSANNGKTFYFCSEACKQAFDKNPKQFVK